jgi:hypothetical protein
VQGMVKHIDESTVLARDHAGGFDSEYNNRILASIKPGSTVYVEYVLPADIKNLYPDLNLKFDSELMIRDSCLSAMAGIAQHVVVEHRQFLPKTAHGRITNFLCCFNRSAHVSRQWVVSWLHHLGWFNDQYCSKHFSMPEYQHFCHTHPELKSQYRDHQFDQEFLNSIVKFNYTGICTNHKSHFYGISSKIQQSFVHLVTETIAESYYPFPTEKFLYPILNKSLWVAYAQPGYYQYIEKYMGFKQYQTFDYAFDKVRDPLIRLKTITDMLEPFSKLSRYDWHDIYLIEKDTIDYNFDLVKSKRFLDKLQALNEK